MYYAVTLQYKENPIQNVPGNSGVYTLFTNKDPIDLFLEERDMNKTITLSLLSAFEVTEAQYKKGAKNQNSEEVRRLVAKMKNESVEKFEEMVRNGRFR